MTERSVIAKLDRLGRLEKITAIYLHDRGYKKTKEANMASMEQKDVLRTSTKIKIGIAIAAAIGSGAYVVTRLIGDEGCAQIADTASSAVETVRETAEEAVEN